MYMYTYVFSVTVYIYIYEESFVISYSWNLTFYIHYIEMLLLSLLVETGHYIEMLLLSLLVETGQLPGAGLTQAVKTCIQLDFYLEILKGAPGFQGGQNPPPAPPKCNHGVCSLLYYTGRACNLSIRI